MVLERKRMMGFDSTNQKQNQMPFCGIKRSDQEWIMELLFLVVLLLQRVLLSSEAADLQLLFSMRLQPLQLLLLSKVAMLFVSLPAPVAAR
ncbi:hypothetical protein Droror1_Dr00014646 [Drosera rotundifolia]